MTKRQQIRSSWAQKIRRGGTVAAALGVMGTLAVAASGCDTVALIGFSERSFTSIHSSGFTPPVSSEGNPDACKGVKSSDGEMRVRFVLADNDARPIRLGEAIDNVAVELTNDTVQLGNSALMEAEDGGACVQGGPADQCFEDFNCALAPGLAEDAGLYACLREDEAFSIAEDSDAVEFVSNTDEHQVYGLLMESTGSLTGWNPAGSDGAWDQDGDGIAETPRPGTLRLGDEIATDFDGERWGAVSSTQKYWNQTYLVARNERRKTFYGLWSFNNNNLDPTSHVDAVSSNDLPWTEDDATIGSAMSNYSRNEQSRNSRANVYEAIENLINTSYDDDAMRDLGLANPGAVEKQLVVFVDGYDDIRDEGVASIDSVVEAAKRNNVRIFIVHLDPKLKFPNKLRDDPMYAANQETCASDADCKNFEVCTNPRGYASSTGGTVEFTGDIDVNSTYCIPRRDEFGRTGPIDDYARLACATAGGYMYVSSPDGLDENLNWTPLALEGLWEAKLSSGEIRRGKAPKGVPLRIHSQLNVNVSGESRTLNFSQQGNLSTGGDSNSDDFDTRGVVFTADE